MTAGVPTGEPDGGLLGHFFTGGSNDYGRTNEVNYADNSMKVTFNSNVYSGFSVAVGFTPDMSQDGAPNNDQVKTVTNSEVATFTDVLSTYAKYTIEMDGVGLDVVYGLQTGNAGQIAGVDYADYEETVYSVKLSYANFSADYRKNDTSNFDNSQKIRTYSADYNLGGGMTIGLVYFDQEQTANNVTDTDVDGIVSKISVGF